MKHFDFTRLEKGKVNKVRHFGGSGDSTFSPSLGKSKHSLNLKGKALEKMRKDKASLALAHKRVGGTFGTLRNID